MCFCLQTPYVIHIIESLTLNSGFPGGSVVKNPPANAGDSSLGGEYPLEEDIATHSSILAWRIPWTEEPGGLRSMRSRESDTTERLNTKRGARSQQRCTRARRKLVEHARFL